MECGLLPSGGWLQRICWDQRPALAQQGRAWPKKSQCTGKGAPGDSSTSVSLDLEQEGGQHLARRHGPSVIVMFVSSQCLYECLSANGSAIFQPHVRDAACILQELIVFVRLWYGKFSLLEFYTLQQIEWIICCSCQQGFPPFYLCAFVRVFLLSYTVNNIPCVLASLVGI